MGSSPTPSVTVTHPGICDCTVRVTCGEGLSGVRRAVPATVGQHGTTDCRISREQPSQVSPLTQYVYRGNFNPGIVSYTDLGPGRVHFGKDCKPLAGTIRWRLLEEAREGGLTAIAIYFAGHDWLSAAATEALWAASSDEETPDDPLGLDDGKLLDVSGVLVARRRRRPGVACSTFETCRLRWASLHPVATGASCCCSPCPSLRREPPGPSSTTSCWR